MSEHTDLISSLNLPEPLVTRLEEGGFRAPSLQCSDIGLLLSVSVVDPKGVESSDDDSFRNLAKVVLSIRQAALQIGLDLPFSVVLDLATELADRPAAYSSFRRTFDRWAGEQDWHRGDFALYLCPPVEPTGSSWAEWTGPKNRDEMVQHLLGQGTDDWGLDQRALQTEMEIARQLEEWAEGSGRDRSDLHGDLLLSSATALRDLDRSRRENRAVEAQTAAEAEAEGVINRWAARHLSAAAGDAAAEERT